MQDLLLYQNDKYPNAIYIIGYFVVENVTDFNVLSEKETLQFCNIYSKNAHIKRKMNLKDLVIVEGNHEKSKLLDKAILISKPKPPNAMRLGCGKSMIFER